MSTHFDTPDPTTRPAVRRSPSRGRRTARWLPGALSVAAIGGVVAFTAASPGSGATRQTRADRTVQVKLERSSSSEVDNAPRGPSGGDTWQASGDVSENGARIGRLEVTTTLVDAKFHAGLQTGILLLTDGSITYQGVGIGKPIPGIPATASVNVYPISGGTGAYDGATGTISFADGGGSHTSAKGTIHLTN